MCVTANAIAHVGLVPADSGSHIDFAYVEIIMVTLMKRFQNPSDREISAWNWTSRAEIGTCQCLQSPHRRHHIAPLHTSSTGSWSSGSTKSIHIASTVTCGTWLTWLDFQENIWQSPINWKNRTVQSLASTCSATNSRFSVSHGLWLFFQSCNKENLNFISIGFWVLSKSNIVLQFANLLCLCAKRAKDVFWQLRMFGKRCRIGPRHETQMLGPMFHMYPVLSHFFLRGAGQDTWAKAFTRLSQILWSSSSVREIWEKCGGLDVLCTFQKQQAHATTRSKASIAVSAPSIHLPLWMSLVDDLSDIYNLQYLNWSAGCVLKPKSQKTMKPNCF